MARTPVGNIVQSRSRTALYAYLAARLDGIRAREFDPYFEQLGLSIGKNAAEVAAARNRETATVRSIENGQAPTGSFRNWILIDESGLGFDQALVTLPGNGSRRPQLLVALRTLAGVRQVVELERDRTILVFLVFRGPAEAASLRSAIEEFEERMSWERVADETFRPSVRTWRALAARAGEKEGLLLR